MKKIVKRLRLFALKILIKIFQLTISILNFNSSLLISKENSYIYEDGILLNINYTNRYLKSNKKKINEGNVLIAKLKILGLKKINSFVDAGANYGEYSFFIANKYPDAKIISIEGSSENYNKLLNNYKNSKLASKNIIFINVIISDKNGAAKITKGLNAENMVLIDKTFNEVKNKNINYEIKECQTLETICTSKGIRDIDVLKIDIEGSEYLLKNDILSLCPLYISMEFAPYLTNNSEYKNMLKILSEKYLIYSEGGGSIQNPKIIDNIDMYIDDLIKKRQPVDILLKLKEK